MGPGERLPAVQTLRGVAALGVVLVHGYDICGRVGADIAGSVLGRLPNFVALANSGVDLFFVISGFVMALGFERYRSLAGGSRQFLLQRAVRTVPLYWLITALFAVRWMLAGETFSARSMSNGLTILPMFDGPYFNAPPIFVGWTLAFEWVFYFAVAVAIARRRSLYQLLAMTFVAALVGLMVQSGSGLLRVVFNPIVAEFGLGVGAFLLWRRRWFAAQPWLPAAIGTALLLLHLMLPTGALVSTHPDQVLSGTAGAGRAIIWAVPWALIVLSAAYVTRNRTVVGRAWERIGDASYSIYLMHIVVFAEVRAIDWGSGPHAPLTVLALFAAASLAAGLAVHQLVERPLLKILKPLARRYAAARLAPAAA